MQHRRRDEVPCSACKQGWREYWAAHRKVRSMTAEMVRDVLDLKKELTLEEVTALLKIAEQQASKSKSQRGRTRNAKQD